MSIEISKVTQRYGSTVALRDISISIGVSEQVALIGPSGCGKTTLLKLIGTQLEPTEGSIKVLEKEPNTLSGPLLRELRTSIASIPQHLGLVPNVRVVRNVLNGRLGKTSLVSSIRQLLFLTKKEQQDAYQFLKRTGIGEKIYDRTDSLSGGQQQRVAVARALYQQPALILADEPISAIDPARARDMISLLTTLSAEEGLTLVVSLHNLEIAREFFPRLIGLRHGEIAFDKSPSDLTDSECGALYDLNN